MYISPRLLRSLESCHYSALLKDYLTVTEREVKNVADVRERETERESMGGYVGACGIVWVRVALWVRVAAG